MFYRVLIFILISVISVDVFGVTINGSPFSEYSIKDSKGQPIDYYLSVSNSNNAPLLLMIQGSGCDKVLNRDESRTKAYSTVFNLFKIAQEKKFSVLAVEKPFSGHLPEVSSRSVEHLCSKEFHQNYTVDTWVSALNASIKSALNELPEKPQQILVFGFSEGAGIASQLALENKSITHVITSGGSGTTHLFDFIAFAYKDCFDKEACITRIENQVRKILKNPASATEFAWGHPYKRWSSFFQLDPTENLLRTKAKIYLMFGTADQATPAISQEIIVAKLLSAGRDIQIRRIHDVGHMLLPKNSTNFDPLNKEYDLAFKWFWDSLTN